MEVNERLVEAYRIASEDGNIKSGLSICNEIILANTAFANAYVERARIYELAGEFERAVADITEALALDPEEPDYYFTRGRFLVALGDFSDSISDLTRVIEMGEKSGFSYYDETARFFRAVAFLKSGRKADALADLVRVRDDFVIYSSGLGKLSKEELVREAE